MTASTYSPFKRKVFIKFDQLTAATTTEVINQIANDPLNIYSEIIYNTLPLGIDFDHGKADILFQFAEEANKRPDKLVERYNSYFWRYFFVSFVKRTFSQNGLSQRTWNQPKVYRYDPLLEDMSEDSLQQDDTKDKEEMIYKFIEKCIEIIDEKFDKSDKLIWSVYRFDVLNWKENPWEKEDGTIEPAPKKLTYDYIAERSSISRSRLHFTVKKIDNYIKDNYKNKFGEPPLF
jgi:hypothetical protein